jgi:hypothetical protein
VRSRERRAFVRLVEKTCAPQPPLPPVEATDAVAAYERWMRAAPRLNRGLIRLGVLTVGVRAEALRAIAGFSYYGDPGVAAIVGHAPRTR